MYSIVDSTLSFLCINIGDFYRSYHFYRNSVFSWQVQIQSQIPTNIQVEKWKFEHKNIAKNFYSFSKILQIRTLSGLPVWPWRFLRGTICKGGRGTTHTYYLTQWVSFDFHSQKYTHSVHNIKSSNCSFKLFPKSFCPPWIERTIRTNVSRFFCIQWTFMINGLLCTNYSSRYYFLFHCLRNPNPYTSVKVFLPHENTFLSEIGFTFLVANYIQHIADRFLTHSPSLLRNGNYLYNHKSLSWKLNSYI